LPRCATSAADDHAVTKSLRLADPTHWPIAIEDRPANQLFERLSGWHRACGDVVASLSVRRRSLARPGKSD
jgi:hypothetical protein